MPPTLKRFPLNIRGRDLVIGDIHGHFTRVERELARIGFRPERDRLICCGDLVDRGPESHLAPQWLERPWFHSVMGNHDAAILALCGVFSSKFELFINHHAWFENLGSKEQDRIRDALSALPWAIEIETAEGPVGVVHAEVPQEFGTWQALLEELPREALCSRITSNRDQARQAHDLDAPESADGPKLAGVNWLFHGHTPRPGCRPGRLGNRLWIDTLGWYDGSVSRGEPRFTILDVRAPLEPL